MFKLNLKIAWRNILKYKSYAAINIIGLALGLAGFIFVVLFINHEKSYDTWNPELENVYQVQEYSDFYASDKKVRWRSTIDLRLSKIMRSIPQVKEVTIINEEGSFSEGITIPGKPAFLQKGLRRSDSLFFKVIPYDFKYGNAENAFVKPQSIVLKADLAIKYFGNVNPVGKQLNIASGSWSKDENLYTVTGVINEPKTPSILNFEGIYFSDGHFFNVNSDYGDAAEVYVKIVPVADLQQINTTIQKTYLPIKNNYLMRDKNSVAQEIKEGRGPALKLAKLGNVHQAPLAQKSWKETLKPVILLSVLLLIVSIINFINLATAQATSRAKEIGIKRVVGAYRKSLVVQFLTETFIQCLFAMFLALLLIELSLPTLNTFFSLNLSLFNSLTFGLIIQLMALIVIVSFLTGLYPSLFLSAYKPHEVLKGNFTNGKNGALVRKSLVAVQFVVSISFVIGILVVNYQLKYLKERDKGFTPNALINIRYHVGRKSNDDFFNKLKRIDGVKSLAFSSAIIGDNSNYMQTFKFEGKKIDLFGSGMGIEGMQALDARLLQGRFFSSAIVTDTINSAIINETAAKMLPPNILGKSIMANDNVPVKIIGIIKDVQVEGFDQVIKPVIYAVETEKWKFGVGFTHKQTSLVRFDPAKVETVKAGIEKFFAERNDKYPANYTFVEDDLNAGLIVHQRFEKMAALFSILSLTLSLFGLFALAAFITKQRTKEIAVRKVLGAENADILLLLNKGYTWVVLTANLIAFPLAYILVSKWLSTFAYRIEVTPLPFVLAFIASVTIAIITVSLQARKVIKENPVNALKYE
ncbi:MAG: FtsX-like permease family protein [Bacteroidota bacterium]